MAHNITNEDGMAYFGEVPWHGLGVSVSHLMTSEEALREANLNWSVNLEPVFLASGVEVPKTFAVVREDTQRALGIVGSRYTPLQNSDAFAFADALLPEGEGRYETAGSLNGGERVWMLAKVHEGEVVPGDLTQDYLLLTNRHDGLGPFQVLLTSVRVVCNNTLTRALNSKAAQAISFRHTPNSISQDSRIKAQMALGLVTEFTTFLADLDRQLTWKKFSKDLAAQLSKELVPVRAMASDREKNIAERSQEKLLDLYETSPCNDN
jgi:phage/plasmid-like protein (TIGR03299 family)